MKLGVATVEPEVVDETTERPHRRPLRVFALRDGIVGVVALATSIVPVANSWQPGFPVDDAFISYSYALHLTGGHGLRLSSFGHPVEAFSDPLWVLILAVGHLVGLSIPTLAMVLGLLMVGLLAATTSAMARHLAPNAPRWIGLLPALLLALLPATAFSVIAGLETLLFALLLELGVLLWSTELASGLPGPRSHLVFALLALTRPEGALVWIGLMVVSLLVSRQVKSQIVPAAFFAVPLVAYELFRIAYFGQLLPNSVVAKSGYPAAIARHLDWHEVLGFWHNYWPILLLAALVVCACYALPGVSRPMRIAGGVLIGLGVFEAAVSSGDGYPYQRYLFVLLPLLLAVVTAGCHLAIEVRVAMAPVRRFAVDRLRIGVRVLGFGFLAVVMALTGFVAKSQENPLQFGDLSVHAYTAHRLGSIFRADTLAEHIGSTYHYTLARLLRRYGRPLVATDEIGIVSYYTHALVLDMDGLGDAHISHLAGGPQNRPDPQYVFGHDPQYVVLLLGGCLCLGVPSDFVYARSQQLESYHVAQVLFDGNAGPDPWVSAVPAAILFERSGPPGSVISLNNRVPAGVRVTSALPPALESKLDSELPKTPDAGMASPSPDLEAAGAMALSTFQAIRAGAQTTIGLPPLPSQRVCRAEATAFSLTATAGTVTLSASNAADGSSPKVTRSLPAQAIETVALPLPPTTGPLQLHTEATTGVELANPRIVCES